MTTPQRALVITSSVYVSAALTHLRDPLERERQYIDALTFFIREGPLDRIIVCDNSGYVYPGSLIALARSHGRKLELLSFRGDTMRVARNGKGYGEGEIMEYILDRSRLMEEVEGFFKVTGRLKVVNMGSVFRQTDPGENYFMPVSLLRPRWLVPRAARPCVEVRVYYTTKAFFREVLLKAYKEVMDDRVFFLEHAYYKAMAASGVKVKNFPAVPEITGVSGSNGWTFRERSSLQKILVKAAHRLGYIKPV